MKKIAVNTFNIDTKKRVALYTQELIKYNFKDPIIDANNVLKNNVEYFCDNTLGETILKQSLIKGLFPRLSYQRGIIEEAMKNKISEKIHIDALKEKSDFRLIGEILTANRLAESSAQIKKITMNFENPQKVVASAVIGNVNKDITISFKNNCRHLEYDIKAGNNAYNPFSGVVASLPYTNATEPYAVINEKINLKTIQEIRVTQLKQMSKSSTVLKETMQNIGYLKDLPIDDIKKNILIQEEIFKAISLGINMNNPSFYAAFIMPHSTKLHAEFFEKIQSKITTNIFDDRNKFKQYMQYALNIYNENIDEIAKIAKQNKELLKESGFCQIADDLFN